MSLENKLDRRKKPDLSPLLYGKMPPQVSDIESEILGAVMMDVNALEVVIRKVKSCEAFYADANQRIFSAIKRLSEQNSPIDTLIVCEELRRASELEMVGGSYYVSTLVRNHVSSANIEEHIKILLQKYLQRELIRISGQVISDSYEDTEDVFDTLQSLRDQMGYIHDTIESTSNKTLQEIITEFLVYTDKDIASREKGNNGVKFFIPEYDRIVGDLQGGNIYIWAARTSMGKTSAEIDTILKQSKHFPVGVWNGELIERRFLRRCISNLRRITVRDIQDSPEQHVEDIQMGLEDLLQHQLFMNNKRNMTIDDLVSLIKYWVFKCGCKCIWLDYAQIIKLSEKVQNRIRVKTEQIGYVIDQLNEVSALCDVPIILLAQLNREATKGDKKPNLSHLRDSGSIEERVYHVMFLHRPEYYGEQEFEGRSAENLLQFIIAKNGDGVINETIELPHELKYNRIGSQEQILLPYKDIVEDLPF